jgi:hypothetical protein
MNKANSVSTWIGAAVMAVVALGVLTAEAGDMLVRAVGTASAAVIGAALIIVEAINRKQATPAEETPVEITIEGAAFDLTAEGLHALAEVAYNAYANIRLTKDGVSVHEWERIASTTKAEWEVVVEAIVKQIEIDFVEETGISTTQDILKAFPTAELEQALSQRPR